MAKLISSFPSTPSTQDSDFEFGSLTPDSPFKNSPADHLFSNGRLLPHSFPAGPHQPTILGMADRSISLSRATTSRTSSVSSKDSLMSSRSNSSNSSRSSVSVSSSARTSASESSRGKLSSNKTPVASKVVMAQLYGSSQRWQHIVPAPGLKREDSRRGSRRHGVVSKGKKEGDDGDRKRKEGVCKRFLRSVMVACRECHAMEPPTKDDVLKL